MTIDSQENKRSRDAGGDDAHVADDISSAKKKLKATLPTVRIGGVPEHFNYPFKMAQEKGLYEKHGVNVEWVVQKCGTGAMIAAIKKGEIDMCVALTEGIVADSTKSSSSSSDRLKILGTYVKSPLCWAISVGADSKYKSVDDLRGTTFAISRYGSGSHLMAFVLAMQRGWDKEFWPKFKVIGSFEKLRASVNSGETSAFMWETFTTKPYHDSGEVRRVGDITTPWPCFMVAALASNIDVKLGAMRAALAAVNEAAALFHKQSATMPSFIAETYKLKPEDAAAWYGGVDIAAHRFVSEAALERTLQILCETEVLPRSTTMTPKALIDERIASLKNDIRGVRLYRNNNALIQMLHSEVNTGSSSSRSANARPRADSASYELGMEHLTKFDQRHHYGGADAVEECIRACELSQSSSVINIGSGLGGPARYMAWKTGCKVLAVELQEDLHRTASEMTRRVNMNDSVAHMGGDFMSLSRFLQPSTFTTIVSWLTVLHINDRRGLFRKCFSLLKPGGVFYAADFYALARLTVSERSDLRTEVFCDYVPSKEAYISDLEEVGFACERFDDKSEEWTEFTRARASKWNSESEAARVSGLFPGGKDAHSELGKFFDLVSQLFAGGNLGGAVVVARKPLGW